MINDCMKDEPSLGLCGRREPWKLSICALAENICAHVFALTLLSCSNKRSNTLRRDKVSCAALRWCFMSPLLRSLKHKDARHISVKGPCSYKVQYPRKMTLKLFTDMAQNNYSVSYIQYSISYYTHCTIFVYIMFNLCIHQLITIVDDVIGQLIE